MSVEKVSKATIAPLFLICLIAMTPNFVSSQENTSEEPDWLTEELPQLTEPVTIPDTGNVGYLILNGEIIQPPYTVSVRNDTIFINGKCRQLPPREIQTIKNVPRDSTFFTIEATHGQLFRGWVDSLGLDSARILSYEYFSSHPLVESVIFAGEATLQVQYKGSNFPMGIQLRRPSLTVPRKGLRAKSIRYQAHSISSSLSSGALVILRGTTHRQVIQSPRSHEVYKAIESVVNGFGDQSEALEIVRRAIGDKTTVEKLIQQK